MRPAPLILVLTTCLIGAAATAAPRAPARTTLYSAGDAAQQGCAARPALLSKTAWRPADTVTRHCGQLLSTDTLLTVRRWAHT
jgi:hypothetical protein